MSKEKIHLKNDEFRSELKNDMAVKVKLAEVTEKIIEGKLSEVKHKAVVLLNKKYYTPTTKENFDILLMTLSNVKDEALQKKVLELAKKINDEFRSELLNDLVVNVKLTEVTEKIKDGKLSEVKHKATILLNKKYCTPNTKENFQILLMTLTNVKDEALQKKVQELAKKI